MSLLHFHLLAFGKQIQNVKGSFWLKEYEISVIQPDGATWTASIQR